MPYGPKPRPIAERFWPKVDKRGPDECWEWQGTRDTTSDGRRGYGVFYIGPGRKIAKAHRVSWEMANGRKVPEGKHVLHHCDNPPCVNPAHLYAGTNDHNIALTSASVSFALSFAPVIAPSVSAAKSIASVAKIITELQRLPRRSQASIAAQFGIKQPQVSRIMRRESWAHLWDE